MPCSNPVRSTIETELSAVQWQNCLASLAAHLRISQTVAVNECVGQSVSDEPSSSNRRSVKCEMAPSGQPVPIAVNVREPRRCYSSTGGGPGRASPRSLAKRSSERPVWNTWIRRRRGVVGQHRRWCAPRGPHSSVARLARWDAQPPTSKLYTRAVLPPAILACSSAGTPARISARIFCDWGNVDSLCG